MNITQKLKEPFPPEKISWRVGARTQDKTKGIALAYIDARDVMERLDDVMGPERWQALYPHANGKTSCKIGIRIDCKEVYCGPDGVLPSYEWVWKENGAGDSDVEAEKGAFSDAFKRAAVLWGIGRYLYDMPNIWVELEKEKFIKSSEIEKKLIPALKELTKGRIPKAEEKFTPEQKSVQNVIVTRLAQANTVEDIDSLWDEYAVPLENMPEEMMDVINHAADTRREQIQNGVKATPLSHRFAGVDDAINWGTKMMPVISTIRSLKVLDEWEENNRPFIQGLDILKAKKYEKDGKSPKERFQEALLAKRNELTETRNPIG